MCVSVCVNVLVMRAITSKYDMAMVMASSLA